ncbi:MAG TPA: citramalate synthase [Acidimicrobiales bacterium]|nr:citramalate synthase [Acidimicrobiales bacterium]
MKVGSTVSGDEAASTHSGHLRLDAIELPESIEIYDTTLRDGSQQEGISLSVDDKIRVAQQLDHLGMSYIEGGWPGANPKDIEFFARAADELHLINATLTAFGSTRRAHAKARDDETLRHLIGANTTAVCIVAKSSDLHVTEALRTTLEEGIDMVRDSVRYLCDEGREVLLDAEHFFDGYRRNRDFALRILNAAEGAGATRLVLCDTNGGLLSDEVEQIVADVRSQTSVAIGVHFHNDSGCAIANSLAAVRQGAKQVQGCVNGYGERAGNADLSVLIPNLSIKMGIETIGREQISLITPVARHIAEIININLDPQKPYVGTAAFAHKAGLHTSAIARLPEAYEHLDPNIVGNGTRVVVSELAGRSTLAMKAEELGIDLGPDAVGDVVEALKNLEHGGYHFEVADGSLELLMRAASPVHEGEEQFFSVESFQVSTEWVAGTNRSMPATQPWERLVHPWKVPGDLVTKATVAVRIDGVRVEGSAEGNGPVNALDAALRKAVGPHFPALALVHLTDYRVRVLETTKGTGAVTRVLLDSADENGSWSTIGVSENIIEASWQALVDATMLGLMRASEG